MTQPVESRMEVVLDAATITSQTSAQIAVETLAPLAARTPANVTHKSLGLVVHGIGQQRQASTLKNVAFEFVPLLRHRFHNVGIAVTPLDSPGPPEARLWFEDARGENYDIRFIEVWWADCFETPSMGHFLSGIFTFLTGWIGRGDRRGGILGPVRASLRAVREHPLDPTLWQRLIVEPAGVLLAIALLPVLVALWLLEVTNVLGLLPKQVRKVVGFLTNVCTRQLGDMWVYMRDPWNAARIRLRFEERFFQLMEMIDQDEDKAKIDAAFVVAHSMGSVVAYEALTGRRVGAKLTEHFGGSSVNSAPPEFHLFTVGSALNSAWDIAPNEEQPRFCRFPSQLVRWTNRYGTHDPVTRGPLRLPHVANDARAKGELVDDAPVSNLSDVFSDHTAYWSNTEEIVAPLLDRITRGRLATELRMDVVARRRRIGVLAVFKLAAWLVFGCVFVAVLVSGADAGVSDWFADQSSHNWVDWIERHALRPLFWAGALGGIAALVYSTIVKSVFNWRDRAAKFPRTAR